MWKIFDSSKTRVEGYENRDHPSLTIVSRVLYEQFIIVGRKASRISLRPSSRANKISGRNFGKRSSHCEKFPGKREMLQRSITLMRYLSEGKRRFAGFIEWCFIKISLSLTVLLYIYLCRGSSCNFIRRLSRQKRRKLLSDAASSRPAGIVSFNV